MLDKLVKSAEKLCREKNHKKDRLPAEMSEGVIFTDSAKKEWRLGRSVGHGAYGRIYLASGENIEQPVQEDTNHVIKVVRSSRNDSRPNELDFYLQSAQGYMICEWIQDNGLEELGIPPLIGYGYHDHGSEKYTFMILPRLGLDIKKVLLSEGGKFSTKTVFTLAAKVLNVLDYVHSKGYIHGDLKSSNLLLSTRQNCVTVYLVDYGLSAKYLDVKGCHEEFKEDGHKAFGTLPFSSRDAHFEVHSRRGDLESLGYNLVHWLGGQLPWTDERDVSNVKNLKFSAMKNISLFLRNCFKPQNPPEALNNYLQYVANLGFKSKPDYAYCMRIFRNGIRQEGFKDDGKLVFIFNTKTKKRKTTEIGSKLILVEKSRKKTKLFTLA